MSKPELHFDVLPQVLADLDPVRRKLLLDEVSDNLGTVALLVALRLAETVGSISPALQEHAAMRCAELGEMTREVLNELVDQILFVRTAN